MTLQFTVCTKRNENSIRHAIFAKVILMIRRNQISQALPHVGKGALPHFLVCMIVANLAFTLPVPLKATTIAPDQSQPRPTFASWDSWLEYVSHIPAPGTGCFEASYPNTVWQRTTCTAATSGIVGTNMPLAMIATMLVVASVRRAVFRGI